MKGPAPATPRKGVNRALSLLGLPHTRFKTCTNGGAPCGRLHLSLGRTGWPPARRSPSTPTGCWPGAPRWCRAEARHLHGPAAKLSPRQSTLTRARELSVAASLPVAAGAPEQPAQQPGPRTCRGERRSGEQAGCPPYTHLKPVVNDIAARGTQAVPEHRRGHRRQGVGAAAVELQRSSMPTVSPHGEVAEGSTPPVPQPSVVGGTGTVPTGAPLHSFLLPSCAAQKAQHLASQPAHVAPSRDPQVPEKPPQGSQRGPMLPEEQGGWGPSAPSCSRGLG